MWDLMIIISALIDCINWFCVNWKAHHFAIQHDRKIPFRKYTKAQKIHIRVLSFVLVLLPFLQEEEWVVQEENLVGLMCWVTACVQRNANHNQYVFVSVISTCFLLLYIWRRVAQWFSWHLRRKMEQSVLSCRWGDEILYSWNLTCPEFIIKSEEREEIFKGKQNWNSNFGP